MEERRTRALRIEFSSNRLERAFTDYSRATRDWGEPVGRKYVERIVFIQAAATVADLRNARSLRFHALSGRREGQYAVMLTGNWRLVLSLRDGETGTVVIIEEVVDYHGN
jgi:proteic killer suppression protein